MTRRLRQASFALLLLASLAGCATVREIFAGAEGWQKRISEGGEVQRSHAAELAGLVAAGKLEAEEQAQVETAIDGEEAALARAAKALTDWITGRGVEGTIDSELQTANRWADEAEDLLAVFRLRSSSSPRPEVSP